MARTLPGLHNSGGGHKEYVLNISGYPWAVATSQAVIDAMDISQGGQAGTDAQTLRRQCFGQCHFTMGSEVYPADSVPIFPFLDKRSLGEETWTLREDSGILDSSGWSFSMADGVTGHAWAHKQTGDTIWGLEGVRRVAQLEGSDVNGWGYLAGDLLIESDGSAPTSFDITDENGQLLTTMLGALSGSEWAHLWIDKECVSVSGKTGTYPNIAATVCDLGEGRGLYRSRPANHIYRPETELLPKVSTVPPSIAGGYVWLWEIPLSPSGTLITDDDDVPLYSLARVGEISNRITLDKGKIDVSVLSPIETLKMDTEVYELVKQHETHPKGFLLCRGSNCGTDGINLAKYKQSPHLVIHNINAEAKTLFQAGFISDNGPINYNLYYDSVAIWLCRQGESVYFETVEELYEAINDELDKVFKKSPDQKTADGSAGNEIQTLTFPYIIQGERERDSSTKSYMLMRRAGEIRVVSGLANVKHLIAPASWASGPLTWMLKLGKSVAEISGLEYGDNQIFRDLKKNPNHGFYKLESVSDKMVHGTLVNQQDWHLIYEHTYQAFDSSDPDPDDSRIRDLTTHASVNVAKYYFQTNWIDHGATPDDVDPSDVVVSESEIGTYRAYHIPPMPSGDHLLLLDNETASTDSYSVDENVEMDCGWFPKLTATVATMSEPIGISSIGLEVDGDQWATTGGDEISRAFSMFYIPALEATSDVDASETRDPFTIRKNISVVTDLVSNVFRLILGDSEVDEPAFTPDITLTHNPFFTTIEELGGTVHFQSMIDWNSLDEVVKPYQFFTYFYSIDSKDTVFTLLKNELTFACAHMTYEYSHTYRQYMIRFRKIQPINGSMANVSGRVLNHDHIKGTAKTDYNQQQLANSYEINVVDTNGEKRVPFYIHGNRTKTLFSKRRTIKVSPQLSRTPLNVPVLLKNKFGPSMFGSMLNNMKHALNHLSQVRHSQTNVFNLNAMYNAEVGLESVLTDDATIAPGTGAIGLDGVPVLVISRGYDITDEVVNISYVIGSRAEYGWAPACKVLTGNFSVDSGTQWTLEPEDHEFTNSDDPKDLYFFDCFSFLDPENPKDVTSCSCSDYAVLAYECGTSGWTPRPFTAEVDTDSDPHSLILTGDTTGPNGIDTGKNYIISFDAHQECEACQLVWIFFADYNNQIGDDDLSASRWI